MHNNNLAVKLSIELSMHSIYILSVNVIIFIFSYNITTFNINSNGISNEYSAF